MKLKSFQLIILAVFVLLALLIPEASPALDLIVEMNPSDTSHFSTIQSALDFVTSQTSTTTSFRIMVERGTYGTPASGTPITLISNVPIVGRETAQTIITGSGTGTLFAATDKTGVAIRNFTLQNAAIGIQVTGTSNIEIANNIFKVGTGSTAVQTQGSSGTSIVNNTFYQNATAVSRDNVGVSIKNNIFYNSADTVQISQTGGVTEDGISFNLFFPGLNGPKGSSFIPNVAFPNPDPHFVAPASNDFHIELATPPARDPAIDQGDPGITDAIDGTTSDVGAYGGPNADKIPFQLSKPTFSSASSTLSWQPNNSYLVTNPGKLGSYNVYYNLTSDPTTTIKNVTSPGVIDQTVSTVITGLTTTVSPPGQPILNPPDYADGVLMLSWSFVPDATGYNVHFLDSMTGIETTIDAGNTLFFILTGLVNGREYGVTVSAYSKAAYHFKVTALDNVGPFEPGVQHESAFSEETTVEIGSAAEGLRSSPTRTAFPDRIVAGPDLPNKGCFIATAAFGHYSTPQVQLLRTFRDRFLITNKPGQAFVDWYYRYGPIGAEFINAHPWLKPAVRIALLPLIGTAWFMTETSFTAKLMLLFVVGMMSSYLILRRKSLGSGRSN